MEAVSPTYALLAMQSGSHRLLDFRLFLNGNAATPAQVWEHVMARTNYQDIVRRNARRWEAMAPYRPGMTLAEHRAGVSALGPEELSLLGDLAGKSVLHLACSTCDEGITMALAGASVVGVDISPTHVRIGHAKADALGADVRIRVGDMMNLDNNLRDFDLAYISTGGICWVPDLDDWLAGVRKVLVPGGSLLISEHHPIWEIMGVVGERQLAVLSDYFGEGNLPPLSDRSKWAGGAIETEGEDAVPWQYFVWGLGEVVSALIRHDFEILALLELPYPDMYRGLGEADGCVPAVYRLMAKCG